MLEMRGKCNCVSCRNIKKNSTQIIITGNYSILDDKVVLIIGYSTKREEVCMIKQRKYALKHACAGVRSRKMETRESIKTLLPIHGGA